MIAVKKVASRNELGGIDTIIETQLDEVRIIRELALQARAQVTMLDEILSTPTCVLTEAQRTELPEWRKSWDAVMAICLGLAPGHIVMSDTGRPLSVGDVDVTVLGTIAAAPRKPD